MAPADDLVEAECADATVARYQERPASDLLSRSPSAVPLVRGILEENSPGQIAPSISVFIGHGDADQQVPVELSGQLQAKYCALGAAVTRRVYTGQDHDAVIDSAIDDAMAFIAGRYDTKTRPATADQ